MKKRFVLWVVTLIHGRDFTFDDIVKLYDRDPPYADAIRCFTCDETIDNWSCNSHAPDVFCPADAEFCFTHHEFHQGNASKSNHVQKSCMTRNDCKDQQLGCVINDITGLTVCRECCAGEICNIALPVDNSRLVEMYVEIGYNKAVRVTSTLFLLLLWLFVL